MSGFTIVELMIATAVFSLVLLGVLSGFIHTGNLFYKGVSVTQTQNIAKQIVDDVSANIASSNGVSFRTTGDYNFYCIGNVRYTYIIAPADPHRTNTTNWGPQSAPGNYGLMKGTFNSGNCPDPTVATLPKDTEMLGDNMRLSQFSINSVGTNLYNIVLTLAYGANDSLQNPGSSKPACVGGLQAQQFCAVTTLSTSVFAGFGQ